jgi:hypothetical protein
MINPTSVVLIAFSGLLLSQLSPAQTLKDLPMSNQVASTPAIPEYLVYRHFLAWVGALDRKESADREADPYKFAASFSRARLRNSDLDVLKLEAKSLDDDLRKLNVDAKPLIAAFREKAKKAAQSGGNLPPVPSEIRQMQAKRTAIIVQHMVKLQSSLGSQTTAQLNAYLQHEFVPHISLKALAKPLSDLPNAGARQTFHSEGQ